MTESDLALFEQKWRKFLKYRWLFSFIPFLDFVLVAGSLASGNVHADSDFDVIVGARNGRIFTVRDFCVFIFGILGIRRKGLAHKKNSRDKICFNHFVTSNAYRLSPPYNDYWIMLYQSIIPVYGDEEAVKKFFAANEWALRKSIFDNRYWRRAGFNPVRSFLEFILSGFLGDFFEKFTKKIQIYAIEKGIQNSFLGFKPRIRYDDEELEFHPDTLRIEHWKK